MRCEDYPCCGHGPTSSGGDGGGCPDSSGRFACCECGGRLPRNSSSAMCSRCRHRRSRMTEEELEFADGFEREAYGAEY